MDKKLKGAKFGKLLLENAREIASKKDKTRRLPDWIDNAEVLIGHIHNTTVFIFVPSINNGDKFVFQGEVNSIAELITDVPSEYIDDEYTPYHEPGLTPTDDDGIHITGGGGEEAKSPVLMLTKDSPSLFDVSEGHHVPVTISNILIRFTPEQTPVATAYIPFGIMVHDYDFERPKNILGIFNKYVNEYLDDVLNTEIGDYYESRTESKIEINTDKENSVIILGNYDGGSDEKELHQFREGLESHGYQSSLIKELPAHPSQSLSQKVKFWCLTARFVVLIDREPSGHIREYTELVNEDIPLALLRQVDSGSTFMIGHEYLTNDFVELFEFKSSPNEVLEEVIEWAEDFIPKLSDRYNDAYPWRD